MIFEVKHDGQLLAIIMGSRFAAPGIHFLTPDDFSQQLAYMNHPAGKVIASHFHRPVQRDVRTTQEVLFIRKGKLRVDFYDHAQCYLESYVLGIGDVILLATGGHGFEVLEPVEMIEVKQGPYAGAADKTVFPPATPDQITIKTFAND